MADIEKAAAGGANGQQVADPEIVDLATLCTTYDSRWFSRPLTDAELAEAAEVVDDFRAAVRAVLPQWEDDMARLPSSSGMQDAIAADLAVQQPSGIRRLISGSFRRQPDATAAVELLGTIIRVSSKGHEHLRYLRATIAYLSHFERECSRERRPDRLAQKAMDAGRTRDEVTLLERRLAGDLASQESQSDALSIGMQFRLSREIRQLTLSVAALTWLLVFFAAMGLLFSIFSVTFG